nr:hypothetical protein [Tanacetum cinerariifolium]
MNQTQRANNAIKNDTLAALYGKYNYEKGLIDQIYKSESSRFTLHGSNSKALISNSTMQDSDSDVEEDQRSSSEFLADLHAEFQERALLANQKRFYKRSGRVGFQRKPIDKTNEICFACGKLWHFQKDYPSIKTSTPPYPSANRSYNKPKFHTSPTPQHNSNVNDNQKDYKVKYKGLKAEIVVLTKKIDAMNKGKSEKGLVAESFDWDEELAFSDDEGMSMVKAFMAIVDEEQLVRRNNARLGQWDEITMKKEKLAKQVSLSETRDVLMALGRRVKRKEKISSKEMVFKKPNVSSSETSPEIPSDSESEGNTQTHMSSLPILMEGEPSGITKGHTFPKTKHITDKMAPMTNTQKTHTKTSLDSSTKKLLLTLMQEVKGLKEHIKSHSKTSLPTSQLRSSKFAKGK